MKPPTSLIITPTIGRIVHYHPGEYETAAHDKQPLPGIVVFVHNARLVNLVVFDMNGFQHQRPYVDLMQEGDEIPEHPKSYAAWMPYQAAQARKDAENPVLLR